MASMATTTSYLPNDFFFCHGLNVLVLVVAPLWVGALFVGRRWCWRWRFLVGILWWRHGKKGLEKLHHWFFLFNAVFDWKWASSSDVMVPFKEAGRAKWCKTAQKLSGWILHSFIPYQNFLGLWLVIDDRFELLFSLVKESSQLNVNDTYVMCKEGRSQ